MSKPSVGFAGLSHLGLVSATAAAAQGFRSVAFDPDGSRVGAVESGRLPVFEPGLADLIAVNRGRLAFANDPGALGGCNLVYVAADVPTDDAGRSDLAPIRTLLAQVTGVLADGAVLVVLSQVPPGFTRGLDLSPSRLYCQVETLVVGRAVERALRPERFIVGCADPDAPLPRPLQSFLDSFDCPILPMRYESAELAKISVNLMLAATVSATNTLAELCENVGADWAEIAPALSLDGRIGPHAYLRPGLGLAGGNLERDLTTALRLAEETGSDAGVVRAWAVDSAYRRDWALRVLHESGVAGDGEPTIALLGLAYKANTGSTKNSPALSLIAALGGCGFRAYDPAVAAAGLGLPGVEPAPSALDACLGATALAVMTPWPEFAELAADDIAGRLAGNTVVDPFGVLDASAYRAAGLYYRTLGRPAD